MGKNSTNSKVIFYGETWEHERDHAPGWNLFAAFEVTLMNMEEKTLSTSISTKDKLLLHLDSIENLVNQVMLTLDDLRGDILDLDEKVDDNHDAIFSSLMDVKSDLTSQIEDVDNSLDDRVSSYVEDVNCTASDAYSMAEDLQSNYSDLEKRFSELEDTMADVLLLKN
jgi:predicted nuclease with TOPRIM domain